MQQFLFPHNTLGVFNTFHRASPNHSKRSIREAIPKNH